MKPTAAQPAFPRFWPLAAVLAVLTIAALGRTCGHDFIRFDDPLTIANNPDFDPPTLRSVLSAWTRAHEKLYIPITYTAWAALAALARVDGADALGSHLNPWVFHSANLLIHIAASILVLAIALRLTGKPFASLLGAAVFAVHPVQVEPVAWASGTKDLLCGAFGFAAILCAIHERQTARRRWLLAGAAMLVLALLSKPTAIVIPLLAIAIDLLAMRTPWRRSLQSFWPWIALAVPFVVIGRLVQPPVIAALPPLWLRPPIAADALAFYLWKVMWPFDLALDYGRTPARAMERGWLYVTWIAPLAIAVLVFAARRRVPLIAAGAVLAVLGVLPVLGFVAFTFQSISTVADHYLYPSMLGVALVVAATIARVDAIWQRTAVAAIVLALAARAFDQAGTWRNDATVFAHALNVNPLSAMSRTNLALHLYSTGDLRGAVDQLEHAVSDDPDFAFARLNLARLRAVQGRFDDASEEYRHLLRIYATQRNYDPVLAAQTQAAIDSMLSRARQAARKSTATTATQSAATQPAATQPAATQPGATEPGTNGGRQP